MAASTALEIVEWVHKISLLVGQHVAAHELLNAVDHTTFRFNDLHQA